MPSTINVHLRITPELLAHARAICHEHGLSDSLSMADVARSMFLIGLQSVRPGIFNEQAPREHLDIIMRSQQFSAAKATPGSPDRIENFMKRLGKAGTAGPSAQPQPNPLQHLAELDPADRTPARNLWAWAEADASGPEAALQADIDEASAAGDERRERIARWLLAQLESGGPE